jgi:hypothetical protein
MSAMAARIARIRLTRAAFPAGIVVLIALEVGSPLRCSVSTGTALCDGVEQGQGGDRHGSNQSATAGV